ncbi:unnamed protein product [Effrenium voratum]|nr:unnamed protein product [Effrenium voratum]
MWAAALQLMGSMQRRELPAEVTNYNSLLTALRGHWQRALWPKQPDTITLGALLAAEPRWAAALRALAGARLWRAQVDAAAKEAAALCCREAQWRFALALGSHVGLPWRLAVVTCRSLDQAMAVTQAHGPQGAAEQRVDFEGSNRYGQNK